MKGLTQARLQQMDDAELAKAATALDGFCLVKHEDGSFSFAAYWSLAEMSPSAFAKLVIIPRLN